MKRYKSFSLASSIYILAFLSFINFFNSSYPWIIFCIPVFIIWPLAVCFPKLFLEKNFSFFLGSVVVSYYAILNLLISPDYSWAMYVAFAVMWYPFSLLFSKKPFCLSVFGLIWSILFFCTINIIYTPEEIWAIYPIFAVFWWPLSVFFFVKRKKQ